MPRLSLSTVSGAVLSLVCLYLLSSTVLNPSTILSPGGRAPGSSSEGSMIVLVTFNSRESSYDILSLSNKKFYTKKHGYVMEADFPSEGTNFWYKLDMIEDAIKSKKYDWIWWLDFDTLITNTTIAVTDVIANALQIRADADNIDLILTPDCWPLNAGSMLIRASPQIHEFLALVRECGNDEKRPSEQDCMRDILGLNKDIPNHPLKNEKWARKTIVIPQKTMNAFPEEIRCQEAPSDGRPSGLWQPGDFVIHFAGAFAHLPNEKEPVAALMKKYRGYVDR